MLDGCKKCIGIAAVLFLVFGVLFLLQDLDVWNFWNISWYTTLFIMVGVLKLEMRSCPDCMAIKTKK